MPSPNHRLVYAGLLIALLSVSASCSNDDATAPEALEPCTGTVTVTVSTGTTPTFTWTPACRVLAVLVEEGASDRWYVEATGDGIAPGVKYGTVPPGGSADEPAIPLVPGTTYEVILFRGTAATSATIAAIKEFTPLATQSGSVSVQAEVPPRVLPPRPY